MAGNFKVLIAGGSLVGLTLAISLEHAGIDYELFEKGDFAPQMGASIGFYPQSNQLMDQLGVWAEIEKGVIPLRARYHFDENGYCMEASIALQYLQHLKYPTIFMERSEMLRILHDHIADPRKLHSQSPVVAYEETPGGITVTTADGQKFQESILIGADGIHSRVRQLMAYKIRPTDVALAEGIEQSFASEYKCLFAVSRNDPAAPFLPDGIVHNAYHQNHSAITATGVPGLVFWFFFVKVPSTRTPNCPRFTEADADAVAHEYGHVAPGPGYTIRDLWTARVKGSLVSLEEGIVSQWSHGRVLLLGDAAHKVTPNAGFGGNLALEGVAHLTNALVALLQDCGPSTAPEGEQLGTLFAEFDRSHRPRATAVLGLSAKITRYEAQATGFLRFAARYLSPMIPDRWKAALFARFASGAPRLEFLPVKTAAAVATACVGRSVRGQDKGTGRVWLAAGLVGVVAAVGLATFRR
ncbi:FAD-dependent oxidoreductase [Aspergillus aculeatinus CBS 121060]|uniref:FAD/NAD(P)-binding domain-containing protein n=1 Tax=Aspergillus aculeatinus CBS 121060 TaxID=1448322 RepID=A0ACD1HPZ9_9EURO|nr:FAD/NAD(P)-binding domain-containing protein [Aspergillus aculeatinus CBS 121060]RAH75689.1 FAD/NAD(P)-binding domain-containing protein [Aspergillus aculeatinus CBS 121060]